MAKNKSASGQIRIIAGQWRSRKLPIHDLQGLRPTTDRVKETVFNWLMTDVRGARVLDCFAGSGSLSFEALSRYADHALLFELQATAAKQLQANLQTLKCENADVLQGDSLALLKQQPQQPYNLVFIDPPFNNHLVQPCIDLLNSHNWLAEDALIYVEMEVGHSPLQCPENWKMKKNKQAGQVDYRLYQVC